MIRAAIQGNTKNIDPKLASLMLVYTLSSGLGISPLEIYKMPVSMVQDLFLIHTNVEKTKAEELDKAKRKAGV